MAECFRKLRESPADALFVVNDEEVGHDAPIIAAIGRKDELGLSRHFLAVVELTRKLFGSDFEIRVEQDPEIADWSQVVFSVRAYGSTDELLEWNTQWHRRLPHSTTEASGAFCLSLDERP